MAMEEIAPFAYHSLELGHIRLLRIQPCVEDHLSFEIKHFSLEPDVNWRALSYVWGQAFDKKEMRLYGYARQAGCFSVTPNLYAALIALGKNAEQDASVDWIWIDAICINQADDIEKATQIPLMGQIYRQAASTIVWFGQTPGELGSIVRTLFWLEAEWILQLLEYSLHDSSVLLGRISAEDFNQWPALKEHWTGKRDEALAVLEEYDEISSDQLLAFRSFVEILCDGSANSEVLDIDNQGAFEGRLFAADHPFWTRLVEFMVNDWFGRVWTYQEIALAQDAHLLLDDRLLMWATLDRCRKATRNGVLTGVLSGGNTLRLSQRGYDYGRVMRMFAQKVNYSQGELQPASLKNLLVNTEGRSATNPRDAIYGMLGLVDDRSRADIVIDYAAPVAPILVSVLNLIIKDDPQDLSWAWHAFGDNVGAHIEDLPSWCPDFTISAVLSHTTHLSIADAVRVDDKFSQHANAVIDTSAMVLRCEILHLDQVENCSDRFRSVESTEWFGLQHGGPLVSVDAWRGQGWHQQFHALRNTFSEKSLEELFWWISNPSNAERVLAFDDLVRFHDGLRKASDEDVHSLWDQCNGSLSTAMGMYLFMIGFGGHHVFQTMSGRLGISNNEVHQGEHIVFLPGGESLFVLSVDEKRYRGVAYVHGLMEHALLDPPIDLALEWKTVELV